MTNQPKDRRLGRGLAALLGTPLDDEGNPLPEGNAAKPQPRAGGAPSAASSTQPAASSTQPAAAKPAPPATQAAAPQAAAQRPSASQTPASPAPTAKPAASPTSPTSTSSSTGTGTPVSAKPTGRASDAADPKAAGNKPTADRSSRQAVELNVYEIENNPFQPRREFNPSEIASLAESLKEHEQLQPILVRRVGDRFQLISGERRLRAAIHAGMSTVRAEIREADDRLVAELAIIENLQRKDLNSIEKAMSFRRYIDQHGCTQDELGKRLKIDRSTIANLMRLLELPQPVLDMIQAGTLSAGHGRAILSLGDERQQVRLAKQMVEEGWSVRTTEMKVSEILESEDAAELGKAGPATAAAKRTVTPHVESLQQELRMQLGTKVEIRQTARGKGKITIHFANPDEFERLRAVLSTQSTGSDVKLHVA
ncbi:ParB/RepB/Spo0J family partition protein [Candidatus Laterigemmans baculatus]|uniref:ParB/RepB/Spo0J family partition protein n=1 Tax=Candidatus Laterigemmans baculatus TaxID=2770505 RepID=UPI001F326EB9|nr:ParB/RepB/Spo0J family partition protein [Candidatus Laterigemmans baculatus]